LRLENCRRQNHSFVKKRSSVGLIMRGGEFNDIRAEKDLKKKQRRRKERSERGDTEYIGRKPPLIVYGGKKRKKPNRGGIDN